MDVRGVLSLTCQGMQAIVRLQPSDAAYGSALSETGDSLRFVELVEAERDDAL